MVHMGYGETWAKVILMGEHSVVYGYPAVAAPLLSLKMRAWVTPVASSQNNAEAIYSDAKISEQDVAGSRLSRLSRTSQPDIDNFCDSKQEHVDVAIGQAQHSVISDFRHSVDNLSSSSKLALSQSVSSQAPVGTLKALNYEGSLSDAGSRFGGLERAVKVATEFAGYPGLAFDVVTDSSFPAGRGMGSSAASAGAVIRAILDACDVKTSEQQILKLTNEAEVITHGNPSGLDAATTCSRDLVAFESGDIEKMRVDMPAYLVIADSGIAGSTREAVGNVHKEDEQDHAHVKSIMDELGELARASETDLELGTVCMLGERMNRAHGLLNELNVSHPLVNHLVEAARVAGATGAKMTGGGLGGCLIALAADEQIAKNVKRTLLREGAREVWIHSLSAVESSDESSLGLPDDLSDAGCFDAASSVHAANVSHADSHVGSGRARVLSR
ncbi:mevalonate kinase [Bifidobacterium sp. ESL0728]|uniref:mevalonate kinase n=1 Tax=Bifidobacterium sp. ESL0728 TaxID=2983220 RepID=UPI0023F699D3|nr:mevalonate kinase [Bifidobacterium sp. ESL0728]WEV58849.1 mevalonate kinase [Bifidobacterium sp. ESL0728]